VGPNFKSFSNLSYRCHCSGAYVLCFAIFIPSRERKIDFWFCIAWYSSARKVFPCLHATQWFQETD